MSIITETIKFYRYLFSGFSLIKALYLFFATLSPGFIFFIMAWMFSILIQAEMMKPVHLKKKFVVGGVIYRY